MKSGAFPPWRGRHTRQRDRRRSPPPSRRLRAYNSQWVPLAADECREHTRRVDGKAAECKDPKKEHATVLNAAFFGLLQAVGGTMPFTASAASRAFKSVRDSLLGAFLGSVRGAGLPTLYRNVLAGQSSLQVGNLVATLKEYRTAQGGDFAAELVDRTLLMRDCGSLNSTAQGCRIAIGDMGGAGCNISSAYAVAFADPSTPFSVMNGSDALGLWLGAVQGNSGARATLAASYSGICADATSDAVGVSTVASWLGTLMQAPNMRAFALDRWRQPSAGGLPDYCDSFSQCGWPAGPHIAVRGLSRPPSRLRGGLPVDPPPPLSQATVGVSSYAVPRAVAAAILPAPGQSHALSVVNKTEGFRLWQGAAQYCANVLSGKVDASCDYAATGSPMVSAQAAFAALQSGLATVAGEDPTSSAVQQLYSGVVCGVVSWLSTWQQGGPFVDGALATALGPKYAPWGANLTGGLEDLAYLQWATGQVTLQEFGVFSLKDVPGSGLGSAPEFYAQSRQVVSALGLSADATVNLTLSEGKALLNLLSDSSAGATATGAVLQAGYIGGDGALMDPLANTDATYTTPGVAALAPLDGAVVRGAAAAAAPKLGSVLARSAQSMAVEGVMKGQSLWCDDPDQCDYLKGGLFVRRRVQSILLDQYTDPTAIFAARSVAPSGTEVGCAGSKEYVRACPTATRGRVEDLDCTDDGLAVDLPSSPPLVLSATVPSTPLRIQYYSPTLDFGGGNSIPNPFFAVARGRTWNNAKWLKERACRDTGPGERWNSCSRRVRTGAGDLARIGEYVAVKGNTSITLWPAEPQPVGGTDGSQFAPQLLDGFKEGASVGPQVTVYVAEAARTLDLAHEGSMNLHAVKDGEEAEIPLARYSVSQADWSAALDRQPGNAAGPTPPGLAGVKTLANGVDAYLGAPHFAFDAAWGGRAHEMFEGLDPGNMDRFGTYVDVEPITGTTFRAAQRLQFMVRFNKSVLFPTLRDGDFYFPIFWGQRSAVLSQNDAVSFANAVQGVPGT